MNNRVVPVVLLALFVTCFVSSLAAGSLALINAARSLADTVELPAEPPPPNDEPVSSEPAPAEDREPEEALAPEPTPWQAPVSASGEFAIFHLAKAKVDPWRGLQKAVKGTKLKAFEGEAPDDAVPPYLVLHDLPVDDYAVITGEALDTAWGLSAAQKKQLLGARRATVIDFVLPLHDPSLREVTTVLASLAEATGGVLWDEECQEYFSLAEWKSRRAASWEKQVPHVAMFSGLREGDDGELHTVGLAHLGLPELRLSHVAPEDRERAGSFLRLVAQQLVESAAPVEPGSLMVRADAVTHRAARTAAQSEFASGAARELLVTLEEPRDGSQLLELVLAGGPGAGLVRFFGD
ncbi:MAG: hypothetical protein ACOZQL_28595 [Myxococcota bacterium]